ncbi:MAG TPA: ABC transporter substrate-binding protein [Casimicrobiaceae bacterium]|nr:ABC transporter substrate-binding protein [Casimicrobiaceae bacterium]
MIGRRGFVQTVGCGLILAQSSARAQTAARTYRIGHLILGSANDPPLPMIASLNASLRGLGFEDGRNLAFVYTYADGKLERFAQDAAELVRQNVDVIVAGTNPMIAAAQRATRTIPIVMAAAVDPVARGFIASLARPGGNITGLCIDASVGSPAKNLALLKEAIPRLERAAVLRQPESGWNYAELEDAARKLRVALEPFDIANLTDIDRAFGAFSAKSVDALLMLGGSLIYAGRNRIADLALKHRMPAIHAFSDYAHAGLLMTYGTNLHDLYRRAGTYIAKILRGARPADLPVEQPATFELVVNMRTAKALGLTIPSSLLSRADELIR